MSNPNPFHASSVLIDGRALLIAGRSGSGKSDLALRLIDRGARLLADDYTQLEARDGRLFASAPPRIAGQIEVRGLGIFHLPLIGEGPVDLLLDLDAMPERMPAEPLPTVLLEGIAIPTLPFAAFESSAAAKAEWAVRRHGLGGQS